MLRKCEHCFRSIKQELYVQHVGTMCPDKAVQCECEMKIKRCELKSHLDNDCEETEVLCQCGIELKRKDEKSQQENMCPEFVVKCEKCECDLVRKDKPFHNCIEHLKMLNNELKNKNKNLEKHISSLN